MVHTLQKGKILSCTRDAELDSEGSEQERIERELREVEEKDRHTPGVESGISLPAEDVRL